MLPNSVVNVNCDVFLSRMWGIETFNATFSGFCTWHRSERLMLETHCLSTIIFVKSPKPLKSEINWSDCAREGRRGKATIPKWCMA